MPEERNRVNVLDENGNVIARVKYNSNLDWWDGHNWTCGYPGHHKGLTKLKKTGEFVLIHGTQWQGERDHGEIITEEMAFQEIMRSGNDELLEKYPELKEYEQDVETEEC